MLDEWKFRQTHTWQILERYGLAALVISIAPYTVQSLLPIIGSTIYILPVVGWVLALWAIWLYGAEYEQCYPVLAKYREYLQPHYPPRRELSGFKSIYNPTIGYVTQFVLLGAISALELLNAYILANLPKPGA